MSTSILLGSFQVRYCLKATSQTNEKPSSYRARTRTVLEIINTLSLKAFIATWNRNLSLVHEENPFADKSVTILVSCGATFFGDARFNLQ